MRYFPVHAEFPEMTVFSMAPEGWPVLSKRGLFLISCKGLFEVALTIAVAKAIDSFYLGVRFVNHLLPPDRISKTHDLFYPIFDSFHQLTKFCCKY